jgi:hypothetical protein
MATLTTQVPTRLGITPTYAAVTGGGDACECSNDIMLHFKNTNAATYTVTLVSPAGNSPFANNAYTSAGVVIPATTGDKMIGPIDPGLFKDPTTGLCSITYTGTTTNGTVAVIRLQIQ